MKEMATILSKEFKTQGNQITKETQTQLQVVLTSDIYILYIKRLKPFYAAPILRVKRLYILFISLFTPVWKRGVYVHFKYETQYLFFCDGRFFFLFFSYKTKIFPVYSKTNRKKNWRFYFNLRHAFKLLIPKGSYR